MVLCTRYPKTVGWHTLKISCPQSSFMHVSPPPVHHITLAGKETLDKAVGTCVSTLPNHPSPTAVDFKISGNQCLKMRWFCFYQITTAYVHTPGYFEHQSQWSSTVCASCWHVLIWAMHSEKCAGFRFVVTNSHRPLPRPVPNPALKKCMCMRE